MKLLTKTSRYYLALLAIASVFSIALLYVAIQYMVYQDVDKELQYEGERIAFYLQDKGEIPRSNYIYQIDTIRGNAGNTGSFRDTLIYEAYDEEMIPHRQYRFYASTTGTKQFRITLRSRLLDRNDLAVTLFISISIIFLVLMTGLFLVNRSVAGRIWSPFFNNLQMLSDFKLEKTMPVELETSDIEEFEQLNRVISALIGQIEKDFFNLKEFNENVSHEMQTPLAVISNKMELLMESPDLTEPEARLLKAAYREVNKLSRISRALILISKIENKEFIDLDPVLLGELVTDILDQLEEMIHIKSLTLVREIKADPRKKGDPILLNILFTNLIKNAIQHNVEGGFIRIALDNNHFEISNSGPPLRNSTDRLFHRFQRGDANASSMGLGLAIVQKICILYDFQFAYHYADGQHRFRLNFGGM